MLKPSRTLLALAMALGVSPIAPASTVIDFETDDDGNVLTATDSSSADTIDNEYADFGVLLSTNNPASHPLRLFDTNAPGVSSSPDPDLETGPAFGTTPQGNVLIIENNPNNGEPNDFAGGGQIIFDFTAPVILEEVGLLDDLSGSFIVDYLDSTQQVLNFSQPGENSLEFYDFTSGPFALTQNGQVSKFTVALNGSGAVTGLSFTAVPEPGTLGLALLGGVGLAATLRARRRLAG